AEQCCESFAADPHKTLGVFDGRLAAIALLRGCETSCFARGAEERGGDLPSTLSLLKNPVAQYAGRQVARAFQGGLGEQQLGIAATNELAELSQHLPRKLLFHLVPCRALCQQGKQLLDI